MNDVIKRNKNVDVFNGNQSSSFAPKNRTFPDNVRTALLYYSIVVYDQKGAPTLSKLRISVKRKDFLDNACHVIISKEAASIAGYS